MTQEQYQKLEELNNIMYTLNFDMGNIKDVKEFKNKLECLTKTVDNLLLMPTGEFVEAIKVFDKKYFGDLYEE